MINWPLFLSSAVWIGGAALALATVSYASWYASLRGERLRAVLRRPVYQLYLFAKINKPGFDGLEFANRLLDHGVGIAPGDGFGSYKSFFRISACQDQGTLQKGMMILDEVLKGS